MCDKICEQILKYLPKKYFEKKYNVIELNSKLSNNKECVFCFDILLKSDINYKCKYCSVLYHKKCLLKYFAKNNIKRCLQCKHKY